MNRYYVFVGGPLHGETKVLDSSYRLAIDPPKPGERAINYDLAWTIRFYGEPVVRLMMLETGNPVLRAIRRFRAKRWYERHIGVQ